MTVRLPTFSHLEAAARCPASAVLTRIHTDGAAAARGRAIHRYLQRVREVGAERALEEAPEEHAAECAAIDLTWIRAGIAERTYAIVLTTGEAVAIGEGLAGDYSAAPGGALVGTPDLVDVAGGGAIVVDYKTGSAVTPAGENLQLLAGAIATTRAHDLDEADVEILYLRDDYAYADRAHLDRWALADGMDELRRIAARVEQAHREAAAGRIPDLYPGDHCVRCPAMAVCPAQQTLVVAAARREVALAEATMIDPGDRPGIEAAMERLTAEQVGVAFELAERMEAAAGWIREAAQRRAWGAPIPLPSGKTLGRQEHRSIKDVASVEMLLAEHGSEVVAAGTAITPPKKTATMKTLGAAAKLIAAKATAAGSKTYASTVEASLFRQLEQRGAAERRDVVKVHARRKS